MTPTLDAANAGYLERLRQAIARTPCLDCMGRIPREDAKPCNRCKGAGHISERQFAALVLKRDARTLQRYLGGELQIPLAIRQYLDAITP